MSSVRIACVGDIMCGDSFSKMGWGVASCIEKHGADFLSEELRQLLGKHDLVLGNVECVLSNKGRREHSLRTLHMRGRPETAKHLADWGFHLAHAANNHILEHGREAACDTVANLKRVGIRVVGAGPDDDFGPGVNPVRVVDGGIELSVIAACFHGGEYAFCPCDAEELLAAVVAEAQEGRLVVVSVHWGDELIDRPNTWQRSMAQRLQKAGATLVIGHHAHVFQGAVMDRNALVVYSLGNFIFDSALDLTKWSVVLSVTINRMGVVAYEAIPVIRGEDFRPMLAREAQAAQLSAEIRRRNGVAAASVGDLVGYEKCYQKEVADMESHFRRELWLYLLRHWFRYRLVFWPQILLRPIQRRLGIW